MLDDYRELNYNKNMRQMVDVRRSFEPQASKAGLSEEFKTLEQLPLDSVIKGLANNNVAMPRGYYQRTDVEHAARKGSVMRHMQRLAD